MTTFFTLLPIYLFGNLHCLGMCGPLTLMIGRHRYRSMYFLGRLLSYTLTGMAAGAAGEVLNIFLNQYHLASFASFFFAAVILSTSIGLLTGRSLPGSRWLAKMLRPLNHSLSILILKENPLSTFLFGFFTVALPCGQTLIVFSACALAGNIWVGLFNGFAFAILTSPSLWIAMHAQRFLQKIKNRYNTLMGISALVIGMLALCRGLAELGLIQHWILNPEYPSFYHMVIF